MKGLAGAIAVAIVLLMMVAFTAVAAAIWVAVFNQTLKLFN